MSRAIQASFDTLTAPLIVNFAIVDKRHIVLIQKRGFGGVALILMNNFYTKLFAFGGKLLLEFIERDTNEVLIVGSADIDTLLATAKVAKHDGSNIVPIGILNNILNDKIEKVIDAIIPSLTQGYQIVCIFVSLLIVDRLQKGFVLVEVAVDGFDIAPIDYKSATTTWIASRKVVYTKVYGKIVAIFLWFLHLYLIDKLYMPHFSSKAWDKSKLLKLFDTLHMLWKLEAKLFGLKPKLFGKRWFDRNYRIALFYPCASSLNGNAHIESFAILSLFFVVWQAYLIAIFALTLELQKSKEASHIPIDKPNDALGYVAQKHLIVGKSFDSMVVLDIVKILAVLEVVLTRTIQSLIIKPCANKTHSLDGFHLRWLEFESVSLCAYCFHTHTVLKSNERRQVGVLLPALKSGVSER